MSHKTLISGTAYEVVGGVQMIDGTKFQMGGGRTLVNGTAFEIGFGKKYTITITGGGGSNSSYISINGTSYMNAGTVEVEEGTIVTFYSLGTSTAANFTAIYIDGRTVDSGKEKCSYSYTIRGDISVKLRNLSFYDRVLQEDLPYGTVTVTTK